MRDCCLLFNNSLSMTLKKSKELLIGFGHKDPLWVIRYITGIDCIDNRKKLSGYDNNGFFFSSAFGTVIHIDGSHFIIVSNRCNRSQIDCFFSKRGPTFG